MTIVSAVSHILLDRVKKRKSIGSKHKQLHGIANLIIMDLICHESDTRLLIITVVSFLLGGCNSLQTAKITSSEQLLRVPYISRVDQLGREYFVYLPRGYATQQKNNGP